MVIDKMRPEEDLLIACVRQHINQHSLENFSPPSQHLVLDSVLDRKLDWALDRKLDWALFDTISRQHGVAPLVYTALDPMSKRGLAVPEAVNAQFKQAYIYNVGVKTQVGRLLEKFIAWFNQKSIPLMLFKGAAYDLQVYAQPWFTAHDVDLIIGAREDELDSETVSEIRALFAELPGFEYAFYDHPDITMHGVLPVNFEQIWADAQPLDYQGHTVWVMCPEDLLLTTCINSYRKRYLRLKSALDIVSLMQAHPELDWVRFIGKATAYDCRAMAHAALYVASMLLNYPLPPGVLEQLQIAPLRRTLIQQISQKSSLNAHAALHKPPFFKLFARHLDSSLILPYLTLEPYQAGRKLAHFGNDGRIFVRRWFQEKAIPRLAQMQPFGGDAQS